MSLFQQPPHNGTPTSIAAAKSIVPVMNLQQRQIFEAIRGATFGMTREEVAKKTGLRDSSVRPRCVELLGLGLIREDGERAGESLRFAKVLWANTPKGMA